LLKLLLFLTCAVCKFVNPVGWSMSFASFYLLTILVHVPYAEAGSLPALPAKMNRTDVEAFLMNELSNAFRGGTAREHISSLEVELERMYTALPKHTSGGLGHRAARYLLHRFFSQKHGWIIRGLELGNASALEVKYGSTTDVSQEWIPGYLQKFIEDVQGGRGGINLRELAVLAATLEDLIHKESSQRLERTFVALELPFSSDLKGDQVREALEVYMMIFLEGESMQEEYTIVGREGIDRFRKGFAARYDDWEDMLQWMVALQALVAPGSIGKTLDFKGATRVVEEVERRYGTWNDENWCSSLKSELLGIESTKAGRVRLADFYKKGSTGGPWAFTEVIEYLHAQGAIDDSYTEPYLIIPNYVASRANCLRGSDFYSLCCRNECEGLMATMEKEFQKPMANAEEILERVASLSTQTVEGPRTLAPTLVRRLNFIADANQGQVPLHGRLFAQWMHHAFPRECPYPQRLGDVAPMAKAEWVHATGHETAEKTREEMQLIVDGDSSTLPLGEKAREHHNFVENELPWDDAEELLHTAQDSANGVVIVQAVVPKAPQRSLFDKAMPAFFILGAAAFAWKLRRNTKVFGWRDGSMV